MPTRWCECHLVSQHILQDRLFIGFHLFFSELFINELIWEIEGKNQTHSCNEVVHKPYFTSLSRDFTQS